jgi:hypothetical protein
MDFFPLLFRGDAAVVADPQGRKWYDMIQFGEGAAADAIIKLPPDVPVADTQRAYTSPISYGPK